MSSGSWPYPAPADDGAAAHLRRGHPLPTLSLRATTGENVSLADVSGRAVLFVYPWTGRPGYPNPPGWDDIPGAHGSTPQAEGFAALYPRFRAISVEIYGLSSQEPGWQREFADRLSLPYALLSDARLEFARALRLPKFETNGLTYLRRLTLVVSGGAIEAVFYPVHPPDTHAGDVLRRLSVEPGPVPL